MTVCEQCGEYVPEDDAFSNDEQSEQTLEFCSQDCRSEWYEDEEAAR